MADTRHTNKDHETIIRALDLIDSRIEFVASNYDEQVHRKWMLFNTRLDIFCFEFDDDRPKFEDIEQINEMYTDQEIDQIIEAMKILDRDVEKGNIEFDAVMSYQTHFSDGFFESEFKKLMWELASE